MLFLPVITLKAGGMFDVFQMFLDDLCLQRFVSFHAGFPGSKEKYEKK